MFFRGSRYEPIPDAELTTPGGRTIRYKRMRFIPDTRGMFAHRVADGERLDLISYQSYKDPEQFWRICDANGAVDPAELTETGRTVRITLPEGITGPFGG